MLCKYLVLITQTSTNKSFNENSFNSDLMQIFHCSVKGLLVREEMRIKSNSLDILTASRQYVCKKCMEAKKENLLFDKMGLKGLTGSKIQGVVEGTRFYHAIQNAARIAGVKTPSLFNQFNQRHWF